MRFETVVDELFSRFPNLEETYRTKCDYLLDEPPMAYIVFGDILKPELESALAKRDLELVKRICIFLEDMAVSTRNDMSLENLMGVEIGEWLEFCANEEVIAPLLGAETKRVCGYVPGLATQRRSLLNKN